MSIKVVKTGLDALESVSKGVKLIQETVGSTIGFAGRTVYIDRPIIGGYITKDGVSVAEQLSVKNPFEDIGVQMIKQAARRTAEEAGDGTTTSTLLSSEMFLLGAEYYKKGYNPAEVKRGMELASKDIIEKLVESSINIKDDEDLLNKVAYISCNGDSELAEVITKAVLKAGEDGEVTIKKYGTKTTGFEVNEGYCYDYGLFNQYFETKKGSNTAEFERPKIIIVDDNILKIEDLSHLLKESVKHDQPLVIMAQDVNQDCLTALSMSTLNKKIKVAVVSLPDYGQLRRESTRDLAQVLNTKVITREIGLTPKNIKWEELGELEFFKSDLKSTVLKFKEGKNESLKNLISNLKTTIRESEENSDEYVYAKKRYNRLVNGVVTINIKANSEVEFEEKYDRAEDATHAVKSAIAEGIVEGGGLGLYSIVRGIEKNEKKTNFFNKTFYYKKYKNKTTAFNVGYDIVIQACKLPIKKIIFNSGEDYKEILKKIELSNYNLGFDVESMSFKNLLEAGVVDPVKVTRCAVSNAVSVSSTLLTTQAFMTMQSYLE